MRIRDGAPLGIVGYGRPSGYVTPTWLIGVPPATLQQWFASLQNAMFQLSSGARVAVASYGQGDGNRSVTFSSLDVGVLQTKLDEVARALGYPVASRRPFKPYYR